MFNYQNYEVNSVAIVDDKAPARASMADIVADADFKPFKIEYRLNSITDILKLVPKQVQAVIFDHNLRVGNYASFNGGEAVSALYQKKIPALLVTDYSESEVDHFRIYRNNIPVIYNSGEFNTDNIYDGFKIFLDEINNNYLAERKPYKTLFRIVELDSERNYAYVIIPSWDPQMNVKIPFEIFGQLKSKIKIDERFFAKINIGAESHDKLYFTQVEEAEKPTGDYANLIRS